MVLVADASPVIFLGKLRLLHLLSELWHGTVVVPVAVRDEILAPVLQPDEGHVLHAFLDTCKTMDIERPPLCAAALSHADNCVLAAAHKARADLVLADDALLRRLAEAEGFAVAGTIGVLFRACRADLITATAAASALDELVGTHGMRISTAVYQQARAALSATG